MSSDTNLPSTDGALLEPEDITILEQIISKARSGVNKGISKLSKDLQAYIESVTVEPHLREVLSDQIMIEIKFKMKFDTPTFLVTMSPRKSFRIDCLSQDIESLVEMKFKETFFNFMQEFSLFLYSCGDSLQELINP